MGKNVIISTLPNISQNYLPKVNTSNIFANSLVYDDGSSVLINTTTASAFKLDVNGTARTGALTLTGALSGTSATFSGAVTANANITAAGLIYGRTTNNFPTSGLGYYAIKTNNFDAERGGITVQVSSATNTLTDALVINYLGAATFSSSVTAGQGVFSVAQATSSVVHKITSGSINDTIITDFQSSGGVTYAYLQTKILDNNTVSRHRGELSFFVRKDNASYSQALTLSDTGAATFSSSVTATGTLKGGGTNYLINTSTGTDPVYQRILTTGGDVIFGIASSTGTSLLPGVGNYATVLYNNTNTDISFGTNQLLRMTITSGGNVGIGTAAPDYLFTIDGKTGDASTVTLSRFYASKGQSGAAYLQIQGTRHPTASVRRMILDAYDGGGASVNLILQQSGGNVGIGTTSPDTYSYGGTRSFLTLQASGTNGEPFLQLIANGTGNSLIDFGNTTIRRATIIGLDGSSLAFYTNGTNSGTTVSERMRITSDGYLRLVTKGIQFNNDTADANSLDDYEEGTWTPTIEGDGSNPTLTYSTQVGRYTKIGRVVTIHCALQPNSTSVAGTGILRFGGLPFTSANIPDVIGTGVANSNGNFNWGTGKTSLIFSVGVNTTKISVFAMQNGTVEAQIPVNNFNNSSQYLLFSITYITAS